MNKKGESMCYDRDDRSIRLDRSGVYFFKVDESGTKFGSTKNIKRRLEEHAKIFENIILTKVLYTGFYTVRGYSKKVCE
jgi:hypothetical protein